MNSWTIALGILEAIAVLVGLFLAVAVFVRIGLFVIYLIAMLDEGRKRLWSTLFASESDSSGTVTTDGKGPEPIRSVSVTMPGVHRVQRLVERD